MGYAPGAGFAILRRFRDGTSTLNFLAATTTDGRGSLT
jgi:hypothetical protein